MVKLGKIYTRGGDQGESGLVDGSRLAKSDLRFAAIGDVDEANSALGVALAAVAAPAPLAVMLQRIQNELFDLGADLATPGEMAGALRILPDQTARLEQEIDQATAAMPPLDSFILPGGSAAAAALHLARAIVRRAERSAVALQQQQPGNPEVTRYLNRLSDHLFVHARALAREQGGEVLWVPGATRR